MNNSNPNHSSRAPRIAASSYLNTAPLIWSFIHGSKKTAVELFTDESPARCAEMLLAGEVDTALVPVIEYQRIPDIAVVPEVCVGSREAVRSVVIASKHDELKNVRRVALDDSSRTSVALVKIIFREFLGFEPEWQSCRANLAEMLQHSDAALIIGDPAMKIRYGIGSGPASPSGQPAWGGSSDRIGFRNSTPSGSERIGLSENELHIFDLATVWREHTGLGFVFAMWMARKDDAEGIRTIDFAGARDEGLAHMDEIVTTYKQQLELSENELKSYLTENIAFQLDDDLRAGLECFFKLAWKHELIPKLRSLKMLYE